MKIRVICYSLLILITGCGTASVPFEEVYPGEHDYAGLKVKAGQSWNQAPERLVRSARTGSRVWTRNGLLLDRIMIIPGVPNGESIFRQTSSSQALPLFDAGMLPNEIEELTESSVAKLFGEGSVAVETSRLRPHRFGNTGGILFNLELNVSDGPDYKGVAGAMIASEKLYLIIFLGAEPYYYDRHVDEAIHIIESSYIEGAGSGTDLLGKRVPDADTPISKISGTYVSSITGNTQTLELKGQQPLVKLVQNGSSITGKYGDSGGKIWGDLDGDTVEFEWISRSGNNGKGKWIFNPQSSEITGNWNSSWIGSGTWNLKRVE